MKNGLILLFKIVLTILSVCYIVYMVPLAHLSEAVLNAEPSWVLLALLFFLLSKYLSACRLNVFFARNGIYISEANNLRLYLLGMFYNLFLPGGVSGDGYKAFLLHRQFGRSLKYMGRILLVDRLSGLLALSVCMLAIAIFIFPITVSIVVVILLPLSFLAYHFIIRNLNPDSHIYTETEIYSFFVQASQLCSALAIVLALGFSNHILEFLFLFLLSSVVSILPFTVGGVGLRELTFVLAAPYMGIDTVPAAGIGVLFYAITAFTSAFGILFVFSPEKSTQHLNGKV